MKEQPNDLWRGGPWEQPSPSFPTPPPVVVPARRPPVLRVRRRRRTLLPFLALFLLVVGLSLGTVAVRWLLPWDDEPLTPHLSEQEERDPFAALERAETGTGVQVQISQREGEVMDAVEIYEKCVPSVVSIQADGEGEYSTGTGVVMSADGYILTNAHVVADSLRMSVLLSDGRVMEARLVGADAGEDLAVLKVEASGLTPAEFGDSDRLRCGEMVVAIGDPLGYRTSITQGIVSALNRTVPVDGVELQVIQTSAPINFGNSGGALINDRGQVVGITTLKVVAQPHAEGEGGGGLAHCRAARHGLHGGFQWRQPAGGRLGGEQQRRPRRIAGRRCAPVPQWGASAHHPGAAPGEKYPDSGGDCYPDGAPGRGGAEHHFLRAV